MLLAVEKNIPGFEDNWLPIDDDAYPNKRKVGLATSCQGLVQCLVPSEPDWMLIAPPKYLIIFSSIIDG